MPYCTSSRPVSLVSSIRGRLLEIVKCLRFSLGTDRLCFSASEAISFIISCAAALLKTGEGGSDLEGEAGGVCSASREKPKSCSCALNGRPLRFSFYRSQRKKKEAMHYQLHYRYCTAQQE